MQIDEDDVVGLKKFELIGCKIITFQQIFEGRYSVAIGKLIRSSMTWLFLTGKLEEEFF